VTNLGSFMAGTLTDDGKVLSAVGARGPAPTPQIKSRQALIELFTGDPWHEPRQTTVTVEVPAAGGPGAPM
jgi:hypothetical protein